MQLYTYEHAVTLLPAVALMLLIGIALRKWLLGKSLAVRMIPIQIIAVLLVLLEIGKQVISLWRGYNLYHLPLHFCSLFIFMLPAMAFYRGRYQQRVFGITAALCISVLVMMLVYPSLIYSDGNIRAFFTDYFSFHTVLFHNLVIFAAILIVFLQVHSPEKKDLKALLWFVVGFCVVSATMAQLLNTNFNNFYSCNIGPLENLRVQMQGVLGYGLTQTLYVLAVSLLDVLFVQGAYQLYRLLHRLARAKVSV